VGVPGRLAGGFGRARHLRHARPGDVRADAVLGLILGGALGNAFDRIINGGGVTDFINFHFWPVFNVADSAVTIGVVLLVIGYLTRKPNAA
jgi:lipoprotein signal peptidase